MFWLGLLRSNIVKVVDLGGNVGNLFYCYREYIPFPSNLEWTVIDLPDVSKQGAELAAERGEKRLRFGWGKVDLGDYDLVFTSGAMHYFEPSLVELLRTSRTKPKWVLINRVPMSNTHQFFAVQHATQISVACRIENIPSFLSEMDSLGYRLADRWSIPDRQLLFPLFPEQSVEAYSGFFFERR